MIKGAEADSLRELLKLLQDCLQASQTRLMRDYHFFLRFHHDLNSLSENACKHGRRCGIRCLSVHDLGVLCASLYVR